MKIAIKKAMVLHINFTVLAGTIIGFYWFGPWFLVPAALMTFKATLKETR